MVFVSILLWALFFLSALLMVLIILLQEPKGGGLGEAFGGMGAQTFGVKTGGVNKFTFIVFAVFVGSALLIHVLRNVS
ncbi:MAG: preprotein translocase subunit SecG [Planctomycetota bacterium]